MTGHRKKPDKYPRELVCPFETEGLEGVPKRFEVSRRNMWMARNCDMAIVYIEHDWGGAYQAYWMSAKNKKVTVNLGLLHCSE